MNSEYTLQAVATTRDAEQRLDSFAERFALDEEAVERSYRCVNVRRPFEPELLAAALAWAGGMAGLKIRDFYIRHYTARDCQQAPLCMLRFSNCYLYPEPVRGGKCSSCGGYVEVPTGHSPTRLQFRYGIGQVADAIYLSAKNAEQLQGAGFSGFRLGRWTRNDRYYCLTPSLWLPQIVVEGENAIGSDGTSCPDCGRPRLRFFLGPVVLEGGRYSGEDFVGTESMGFRDLVFSQRAARFLKEHFRAVRYSAPVHLSSGLAG